MLTLGLISQLIAIALRSREIDSITLIRVTSIVLLFSATLAFNGIFPEAIGSGIGIYNGLFTVNSTTQGIEILLFTVGAFIMLSWAPYSRTRNERDDRLYPKHLEYSMLIIFTLLGSSLLVSCTDLVSMYVALELQSFAVYVLAAMYRDREQATSAGLKYFLLGALSSALILLGAAMIYSYTGLTNFHDLIVFMSVPSNDSDNMLFLGILVIVIGFLFKVAAAPFHNWAPDVYDGVPTTITTWLTIMPKISIFVFLLSFVSLVIGGLSTSILAVEQVFDSTDAANLKNLLMIVTTLSLVVGTLVGLAQTRIKRLLAYSTISHVGFLLLGLAAAVPAQQMNEMSVATSAPEAFLFYLVQYTLTNLDMFLIILAVGYSFRHARDVINIPELNGLFYDRRALAVCMIICFFSIAGIPPLVGFFGKYFVLYSALESGYYYISIVAILASVVSAAYYLRIVRVITVEASPEITTYGHVFSRTSHTVTSLHSYVIATLTMMIVLFALYPSLLLNCTHLMALTLAT